MTGDQRHSTELESRIARYAETPPAGIALRDGVYVALNSALNTRGTRGAACQAWPHLGVVT